MASCYRGFTVWDPHLFSFFSLPIDVPLPILGTDSCSWALALGRAGELCQQSTWWKELHGHVSKCELRRADLGSQGTGGVQITSGLLHPSGPCVVPPPLTPRARVTSWLGEVGSDGLQGMSPAVWGSFVPHVRKWAEYTYKSEKLIWSGIGTLVLSAQLEQCNLTVCSVLVLKLIF